MAKRQSEEQAKKEGEQSDTPRVEQGSLLREERLRQAVKQAKAPVQAPQPVPEEKEDAMEEDVEDAAGTRETPIEVAAEVVAPLEVPKPVEVRQKPRVEERTTRSLPTRRDEVTAAIGQWAGGPSKDKRRVVVDEGLVRRREDEKGVDESKTTVERSSEVASAARRQAGEK